MDHQEIINRMITNDEGGWVFTDYDVPTFAGVTLLTFRDIYPTASVENLKRATRDEICAVYERRFLDKLDECPLPLLPAVFSACVNIGVKGGGLLLQRAANDLGARLKEDGIIGQKTGTALMLLIINHGEDAVVTAFVMKWIGRYRTISRRKDNKKYLKGWINRARRYLPKQEG